MSKKKLKRCYSLGHYIFFFWRALHLFLGKPYLFFFCEKERGAAGSLRAWEGSWIFSRVLFFYHLFFYTPHLRVLLF